MPKQSEDETPLWRRLLESASIVVINVIVFIVAFSAARALLHLFH